MGSSLLSENDGRILVVLENSNLQNEVREYKSRIESFAQRLAPGHTLEFVNKDMEIVS